MKTSINYHLTTIVNFDNFTFRGTILSNDVIESSNWFYFLSNALCYNQIKFRYHKLISLGRTVENIQPKIKNMQNFIFYRFYYDVIKNKPKLYRFYYDHESRVQVLIFRLSLE